MFDLAGNRTQQSLTLNGGAPTVTTYSYNAGNQMTNAGAATLTYDNNGNLTSVSSGATCVGSCQPCYHDGKYNSTVRWL
jgi:hypothetical protein